MSSIKNIKDNITNFKAASMPRSKRVELINSTKHDKYEYAITESKCVIQAPNGFYFLLKDKDSNSEYLVHSNHSDTPNGLDHIDKTDSEIGNSKTKYKAGDDKNPDNRYFNKNIDKRMNPKDKINTSPDYKDMRVVAARPSAEADDWIMDAITSDQKLLDNVGLAINTLLHAGNNIYTNATGLYHIKENDEGHYDLVFYPGPSLDQHNFVNEEDFNSWLSKISGITISSSCTKSKARKEMMVHAYEQLPKHKGIDDSYHKDSFNNHVSALGHDIKVSLSKRVRQVSEWLSHESKSYQFYSALEATGSLFSLPASILDNIANAVEVYGGKKKEEALKQLSGKDDPNMEMRHHAIISNNNLNIKSSGFIKKLINKVLDIKPYENLPEDFYAEIDESIVNNSYMLPLDGHNDVSDFKFNSPLDAEQRYLKWIYNGMEGAEIQIVWPDNDGATTFLGTNGLMTHHIPDQDRVIVTINKAIKDEEIEQLPPIIQEIIKPNDNVESYALEIKRSDNNEYITKSLSLEEYKNEMYNATSNEFWLTKNYMRAKYTNKQAPKLFNPAANIS